MMIKTIEITRVMEQLESETSLRQLLIHSYIKSYPKFKKEIILKAFMLEAQNPSLNRTFIPSWYQHGVKYKVLVWDDYDWSKREEIAVLNISTAGDHIWYTDVDGESMSVSEVLEPHIE